MKTLFNIVSLLFVIALLTVPVFAQDESTEEPAPLPTEAPISVVIETPETEAPPLASEGEAWLAEIGFASLLVTSLVALSKKIPFKPLQDIPSARLALLLNVVVWVAYKLVGEFGGDVNLFASYLGNAGNVSQSLMNIVVTYLGAAGLYKGAVVTNMPLLSAKKSE